MFAASISFLPHKFDGGQAYTEQQLDNIHLGILDLDFDDNSYENKLHVMKSARRSQLRAELLNLKILSQVREELGAVEDLLRPWM